MYKRQDRHRIRPRVIWLVIRKDSLGAAGTLTSEKANAATAETEASEDVREGELVWYNERKGYGFVRIGDEEVFLHRSTLDRFGLVRLLTGDVVTVSLSTNEHGRVIKDLLSVERPLTPAPPAASEPEEPGGAAPARDGNHRP